MRKISRRHWLEVMLLGGLAGWLNMRGLSAQVDSPILFLNFSTTAELFTASLYMHALRSNLDFTQSELDNLKTVIVAEWDHYSLFQRIGGSTLSDRFFFSAEAFASKTTFATLAAEVEQGFASGFLVALGSFATSTDSRLGVTMAQCAAAEMQHLALFRQMSGQLANHLSFVPYVQRSYADYIPEFEPNLSGEGGGVEILPPTSLEIDVMRREVEALGYDSSIKAAITSSG